MKITQIISDSFQYAISDWKLLVNSGFFLVCGVLVLPLFIALGYFFSIIHETNNDNYYLPELVNWGELAINGLKVFLLFLIYYIIPLSLIFAFGMSILICITTGYYTEFIHYTILAIIISTILISFLYPMALIILDHTGSIKSSINIKRVFKLIHRIGWFKYILWYIIMLIFVSIFGSIILVLLNGPFIVIFITALIIVPFVFLFVNRSIGLVYAYE